MQLGNHHVHKNVQLSTHRVFTDVPLSSHPTLKKKKKKKILCIHRTYKNAAVSALFIAHTKKVLLSTHRTLRKFFSAAFIAHTREVVMSVKYILATCSDNYDDVLKKIVFAIISSLFITECPFSEPKRNVWNGTKNNGTVMSLIRFLYASKSIMYKTTPSKYRKWFTFIRKEICAIYSQKIQTLMRCI